MKRWLGVGLGFLIILSLAMSSCGGDGGPSNQDPPSTDTALAELRIFSAGDVWRYSLIRGVYFDTEGVAHQITDGDAWLEWGVDNFKSDEEVEYQLLRFTISVHVDIGGLKRPVNVTTDYWMRQLADQTINFCGYWPDVMVTDPVGGLTYAPGELEPGWGWVRTITVDDGYGLSWDEHWDVQMRKWNSLETPFGKFQDVYRIEMTVTSPVGRTETIWWIVPDIGVVGIDRTEEPLSGETVNVSFRLEDYRIK